METTDDLDRAEHNRVIWHSRRGMLELDIVLERFVKQHYLSLDADQRHLYRRLLTCEDQQLYDEPLHRHRCHRELAAAQTSQAHLHGTGCLLRAGRDRPPSGTRGRRSSRRHE